MSTSYVPAARSRRRNELPTEPVVVNDWRGLASYLAGAVAEERVTFEHARSELVAAVDRAQEARSLRRAAVLAESGAGSDALVARLLCAAVEEMDSGDVD
jgi:hypothetical protein